MRLYTIVGIGCLMTALAAAAQTPMEALNDKVDRLDKELTLLQRKLYQTPEAIEARPKKRTTRSFSLFGGKEEAETSSDAPAVSWDELAEQAEAQNRLIQELTAKVEEQSFQLEQLSARLEVINKDVDMRFQQMQKATEAGAETAAPKKKKTPSAGASAGAGAGAVSAKDPAATDAKVSEDKAAYDAAYALLKKGAYTEAEQAFTVFMEKYPGSKLTGNANYWLGETYYVRGLYEQAVGLFADGFTKYKNNTKAPDNLLKLGLTMKQLKKNEEACTAFKTLPIEFPKASDTLKKRAAEEAKKIACPA